MQPRVSGYPVATGVRRPAINQSARVRALGRVSLFKGLSARSLVKIDQLSEVRAVRAGDMLMQEGELGTAMMVVLEGKASVTRGPRTLGELAPGHVFGEMALLDDQPRSATVTAAEPMRLLVINGPAFRKLLGKVPRLTDSLLAALSLRLREANAAADN